MHPECYTIKHGNEKMKCNLNLKNIKYLYEYCLLSENIYG